MTSIISALATLSDRDLLGQLERAVGQEFRVTAHVIALLMEVDARKLYAKQGCSSLFTYCVQVLHFSEHAAYLRIEAARAARRFPVIVERVANGSLHLTAVSLLAPHLTLANHLEVLDAARHKSKRDVEHLVARLRPQADVPAVVRKLPTPRPAAPHAPMTAEDRPEERANGSPSMLITPVIRPPAIKPIAPERFKVQFTVSRETYEKLCRAGSPAAHGSERRSCGDLRSGVNAVASGTVETKARCGEVSAASSRGARRLAAHSGGRQARGVAARRRPVCVSRRSRPLHRNRFSRVPSRGAIRQGWHNDQREP